MPGESSLPKQFLHLMEKRGARGRRKTDQGLGADAPPPGVERRRGDRRKSAKSKPKKR